MSNPKSKLIPNAFTVYFVMLLVYCVDIFFLKSDLTVLGDAFYSRFVSLIGLFIYLWATKTSPDILGISKKKEKFRTGAVYGIIFSIIPIAAIMAVECVIYSATDINALDLRFSPPSISHVYDIANLTPAAAIIIYIFTSFFGSLFKEFFFRGFMLKKLRRVTKFHIANLVQALLYMSFTIPMLLRNLVNHYYDNTTASLGLFIVIFYIVHETLAGYKWGLLTRVAGSTYVAIVDHFLYVFLSNSVYITNRYVTWSFMLHMLAIQVVSTVMVAVYYRINRKKLEEKEKTEKEKEDKGKKHSESKKEAEKKELIDEEIQKIDEISPTQYKDIVNQASGENHSYHHHHHSGSQKVKLESLPTSEANKIANDFYEEKLNSSHHHHHHSSSNTEKTAEKKAEISDTTKSEGNSDEAIDEFLRNFNNETSSHSQHHHHHSHSDNGESTEITEDFDADSFLENYQNKYEHHHSHSHHHHHSRSYHFNEDDDDESFVRIINEATGAAIDNTEQNSDNENI